MPKIGPSVVYPGETSTAVEQTPLHAQTSASPQSGQNSGDSSSADVLHGLGASYPDLGSGSSSNGSSSKTSAPAYRGDTLRQPKSKGGASKAGGGKSAESSGPLEYPHNGKHRPPTNGDSENARKQITNLTTTKGATALYFSNDAKSVRDLESDARQNGLKMYLSDPKASDNAKTVVHLADKPIGADGGQQTKAMRLDGDHGHPIQQDNPQLNTSFSGYMKTSAKLTKQDIDKPKEIQDGISKLTQQAEKKPLRKGEQKKLDDLKANLPKAQAQAQTAQQWRADAAEYLNNKGESPKQYGL